MAVGILDAHDRPCGADSSRGRGRCEGQASSNHLIAGYSSVEASESSGIASSEAAGFTSIRYAFAIAWRL